MLYIALPCSTKPVRTCKLQDYRTPPALHTPAPVHTHCARTPIASTRSFILIVPAGVRVRVVFCVCRVCYVRGKLIKPHKPTSAAQAISTASYVSTEYAIVSGVKKGTIIAKDPDSVAHTQVLGQKGGNFDERSDYIIITNFDFYFHDIREYFDPTGGKVGHGYSSMIVIHCCARVRVYVCVCVRAHACVCVCVCVWRAASRMCRIDARCFNH